MTNAQHEANRLSWNAATQRHNQHKGDQAAFLKNGGDTLFPEEKALLGDLRGQQLLHLQCNAGQDSLSIAKHHYADVTGVDISDEAITFARQLAQDSGIAAQFIRADLFAWFATNTQRYDVVFTSYGATPWLSDLTIWGKGIAAAIKPGGRFVMIEFHPAAMMFERDWSLAYDYMGGQHIPSEGVGDYVGESGSGLTLDGQSVADTAHWQNPHPAHEFAWGLADHLNALIQAGLTLTSVQEYPYSNGFKPFPNMIERAGRRMVLPDNKPVLPLMFSITAQKPDL
jgi:SAM-dependent methyltransferase